MTFEGNWSDEKMSFPLMRFISAVCSFVRPAHEDPRPRPRVVGPSADEPETCTTDYMQCMVRFLRPIFIDLGGHAAEDERVAFSKDIFTPQRQEVPAVVPGIAGIDRPTVPQGKQ